MCGGRRKSRSWKRADRSRTSRIRRGCGDGCSATYNALADTYTYVWKTDKAWKGKCATLTLKLDDGTEHTALFQFK